LIWILNYPPEVTNVEQGRLKLHQQTTGTTATTILLCIWPYGYTYYKI
jgi:hypothetical protein